jgi:putative DNA primase/helicase
VLFQPNTTRANDVFNGLRAATHLGTVTPPAWLPGSQGNRPPARELLACANGLLHVPTRELHDHTPEFVGLNALPYAYSPGAQKPAAWLAFLQSVWPNDPDTIATLQEWFGYCLTQDTRYHKIMLMIGPKRSGKGTIGRVLTPCSGMTTSPGQR